MGAYRLRARLGAGGMGQVFLGYSPAGRAVAVKVVHRELARDPGFRARFRREVAAASAVSGAYTAPVVAAGPDDDPPWLAAVTGAGLGCPGGRGRGIGGRSRGWPGLPGQQRQHGAGPADRQRHPGLAGGHRRPGRLGLAASRGIVYAGSNDFKVYALKR